MPNTGFCWCSFLFQPTLRCIGGLHIKEFYGTTENAVKIQLYSAIIAYCLVAIVERKMKLNMEMYDLLRILSVSLLDRTPLADLLGKSKPAEKLQTVRELSLKFI